MANSNTKPTSLMVAPNGARKLKSDHPNVPLSVDEIAATAKACSIAGADALHLHVRNSDGSHSLDPVLYREAISAVEAVAPDLPIQITTESAGIFDVQTQYTTLTSVVPKAASVSVREIARSPQLASKLYAFCAEAEIDVQHILYTAEDFAFLNDWRRDGIVAEIQNSVIFVLGQYSPAVLGQPEDLKAFLHLPFASEYSWAMCAFGKNELACAREAVLLGGDLRIGFENNTQLPDGSEATDNAELILLASALRKWTQHE